MATSQDSLPSQIIPTLWGAHRGLLEGLSLLGPPGYPASWPVSLVERVTPQVVSGLPKTLAKPSTPSVSGAGKPTPESSGKKSQVSSKQITGYWKDPEREKEDAEARKQEEKRWKKSSGPVLSLDDHEDSVATLTNWATLS